jgi:hypothetical protein
MSPLDVFLVHYRTIAKGPFKDLEVAVKKKAALKASGVTK